VEYQLSESLLWHRGKTRSLLLRFDRTAGSTVLCARNPLAITISELQAQLKCDHAGRAITAQTNAE
jgi:hypothetical protein